MNVNRISLFTLVLLSVFLLGCSEDTKVVDNIKLAKFYMAQDNDRLALQFLAIELKADKNLLEAHRLMGTLLNNAEYFGDAVNHFQSAIELGCKQVCDEGSYCATPTADRIVKSALWVATVLVVIALTTDLWAPLFY